VKRHHRLALVAALCTCELTVQAGTSVLPARAAEDGGRVERGDRRYNSEYIFATTRGVTDLDAPAAFKVTLVPVTLLIDVALLPFEVVAGCL
jgi:hypothetical protein